MLPNPCAEFGSCLVKASCNILAGTPWRREKKCPIYAKWRKQYNFLTNTQEFILSMIGWSIILGAFLFCVSLVALGLWKWYELIKLWFF